MSRRDGHIHGGRRGKALRGLKVQQLRAAAAFLTIVPYGSGQFPGELGPARAYFPLVGLGLGGVLAGAAVLLRHVLPLSVVAAILLALLLVLTRALHTEGFADCCDALFGGYTRERRLEIMRDPHAGAFAVIGTGALLLWQWSALAALPGQVQVQALLVVPCLSRLGMVVALFGFPYARLEGLGSPFMRGTRPWQLAVALATGLLATGLLAGWAGLLVSIGLLLAAWLVAAWVGRLLGGLTGDVYGAINEVGSVVGWTLWIGIFRAAPGLFRAPLGL